MHLPVGQGDGPTIPLILISLNGTCAPPHTSSQEDCVTILSAGKNSVISQAHGRHAVDIGVRDFWDPEARRYTGHVGCHPRILYWKGCVTPIRPSFYVC